MTDIVIPHQEKALASWLRLKALQLENGRIKRQELAQEMRMMADIAGG